jgi:hypothetical protein
MFWIARAGGQKVTIRTEKRGARKSVPPIRTFFAAPAHFFNGRPVAGREPRGERPGFRPREGIGATKGALARIVRCAEIPGGAAPGRRDLEGDIMKGFVVSLSGALLIAGCSSANEEQAVENLVRLTLAPNGNVQQVDLTKQSDNNYSGFATVRKPNGREVRLNCTARRAARAGNFDILCGQVLDQTLIDEMEASLRRSLVAQGGTVFAIELSRQDDNHVTGHADVRDARGAEGRLDCVGERQANGSFSAQCTPPASGGSPAR